MAPLIRKGRVTTVARASSVSPPSSSAASCEYLLSFVLQLGTLAMPFYLQIVIETVFPSFDADLVKAGTRLWRAG